MEQEKFRAMFACVSEGGLVAGPVTYSKDSFTIADGEPLVSVKEIKSGKEKMKILLFDSKSLSEKRFNPQFVERVCISDADVWLVETAEDVADVADGFLANISKFVIPVHTVKSYSVFEDAIAISDDCVPMIMVKNAKTIGKIPDVIRITEKLVSSGYRNIVVFDIDDSLDDGSWNILREKCPGLISYSPRRVFGESMSVEDIFPFKTC